MKSCIYTQETIEAVKLRLKIGGLYTVIARDCKVSVRFVSATAKDMGLPSRYKFTLTPEQRSERGRRGGLALSRDRQHMRNIGSLGGKKISANREHMSDIGRKGGTSVSSKPGHMAKLGKAGGEAMRELSRRLEEEQT